jgi:hypothetical protein
LFVAILFADPVVEEGEEQGKCKVFYKYLAEKGDVVSITFEDESGQR